MSNQFTKINDTTFTITKQSAPQVITHTLTELVSQRAFIVKAIAMSQAQLDEINSLISQAQEQGIKAQDEVKKAQITKI